MDHTKTYGSRAAVAALFLLLLFGGKLFGQTPPETIDQNLVSETNTAVQAADKVSLKARYFLPKQQANPFDTQFEPSEEFQTLSKASQTSSEDAYNVSTDITGTVKSPSSYVPKRSSGRWVIPDGATEYGVEFGFAPQLATWMSGPKYYDISNRQHLLGSVRWGKILGTRAFVTYSWAIEIQPINIAFGNEVDNPRYLEGSVGEPPRNREATYGVGINPASFRFIFFPQYRLRPMLGAGFGVVRHYKRVPTVEGTKFNFQADFQIGGQYMLKENKALNFGYRYYHLSNLYLFNFNPGYNVNMFFVGYSVFK
jgi:hypothetical protein